MTTKRKVRADFDNSQPITVDVSGCTKDVKKQVIQAFFDVGLFWPTDDRKLSPADGYVKTYGNVCEEGENLHRLMWGAVAEGITPVEFFAMVYEDEAQGHPYAELMMQYAEDAKTHAEPWKLWQFKVKDGDWAGVWCDCPRSPHWRVTTEYRRKPKTHLVHGVEVPDLRIKPKRGESYYYPYSEGVSLVSRTTFVLESRGDAHRLQHNLCYEDTEAGKQAAILHAKAMLGVA